MNERLRATRLRKGWSQEEAAEAAQVAIRTYQRWENGKAHPNFASRRLLREAFGCSDEELGLVHTSVEANSHHVVEGSGALHLRLFEASQNLNEAKQAWQDITAASTFVPDTVSSRRIELLKHCVIGSIALNDLEQGQVNFEAMVHAASALGSDLWLTDIQETHQKMLVRWPHEQRVKTLADLYSGLS